MSLHPVEWAEVIGTAETDGPVRTKLAEAVERATSSRFLPVRTLARLSLAVDAWLVPVLRLVRRWASRVPVFTEGSPALAPSVLRRGLLTYSATLTAIGAGLAFGILPGRSALAAAAGKSEAQATSLLPGRTSRGEFRATTPPPGPNVARLATPPPGTDPPSPTSPPTTQPPAPSPPPLYTNPLARVSNLQPERIDQGVDYTGSGPLVALGSGTIRQTSQPGWPGGTFIALQLDSGQLAGRIVYYAENITPSVRVGQHVNVGDEVGVLHDAYPNLEIGWGGGGVLGGTLGETLARANGGAAEGASAALGVNFNQLLVLLGAPSGIQQGLVGHLPRGMT